MSDTKNRVFTQVFGVVGALIERDGKFLLVQENNPSHPDHGKWNQPAGWIDVGENPTDAVVREVKEETGLTFAPEFILGLYSLVRKDQAGKFGPEGIPHPIKIIYGGTFTKSKTSFDANEISETRWFTPEEIEAMDKHTLRDLDIKRLVKEYLAGKRYPLELLHHTVAE
jgi:ADP-ribose pyrophosphatase YjhB (NUDIX family)